MIEWRSRLTRTLNLRDAPMHLSTNIVSWPRDIRRWRIEGWTGKCIDFVALSHVGVGIVWERHFVEVRMLMPRFHWGFLRVRPLHPFMQMGHSAKEKLGHCFSIIRTRIKAEGCMSHSSRINPYNNIQFLNQQCHLMVIWIVINARRDSTKSEAKSDILKC